MEELSPKQRILRDIKAQVYDQIAIKEQAERNIIALNERINMVDAQPESNVENLPLEAQSFFKKPEEAVEGESSEA